MISRVHPLISLFEHEHLPEAQRQLAQIFKDVALCLDAVLPENVEKDVAMRHLLFSRTSAVHAQLFKVT